MCDSIFLLCKSAKCHSIFISSFLNTMFLVLNLNFSIFKTSRMQTPPLFILFRHNKFSKAFLTLGCSELFNFELCALVQRPLNIDPLTVLHMHMLIGGGTPQCLDASQVHRMCPCSSNVTTCKFTQTG